MYHLRRQITVNTALIFQMPSHHVHPSIRIVRDPKERKPHDVIPMRMSEQQVGRANVAIEEILARTANTGAGIEQKTMLAHLHFDTAGVSTVSHMFR